MFEWQFIGQGIKKRLLRSLLIAGCAVLLFFLEAWILQDLLRWSHAVLVQVFTILLGVCMSFFYLIGGMGTALWATGMMGVFFSMQLLPSPYKLIGFLALLGALSIWGTWKKHRLKQQLLQQDPDMTVAQATEIVATATAVNSNASDDIRREADQVMELGFLSVENVSVRRHKQYLLSPSEKGLTLYVFDQQQRIHNLVLGNSVDSVPNDIQMDRDRIDGITLSLKRRMGMRLLHLTVRTQEKGCDYIVTGSASAAQIEAFITSHCDIPVDNQVHIDRETLVQMPDIAETIRHADSETVSRMRSSRWLNRLLTTLSVLSLPGLFFTLRYPALYVPILLCPVAVTVFYIFRQEDVRFEGSRQGRPSVFSSYFCNPVFTGMFAWLFLFQLKWLPLSPLPWLAGLLGAAAFLFCVLKFIREHHGKVGVKIGLVFMAMAFGAQITAILPLLLYRIGSFILM